MSNTPSPPRANTAKRSLGFLPPLLGCIQSVALLILALVLWQFHRGGTWAAWLLVPVLLLSFVPYFISIYVCAHPQSTTTVRAILFFAILFRLIMWATPPVLSDDIFRYVWEGRVQNHGFNPYALAPNAEKLKPLRDVLYGHINHPEITAIYPPFAQLAFRILASIPHPVGWAKFFFGGIDLLNVWLLIRILRDRKMPPQFALIYAWNPLPALEFAGSGHLLSLAICLFLAAYHALQRDRQILGGVAAGLALGTQFLILAPLMHIYNAIKKPWFPVIGVVFALLYLPYLSENSHLWNGLTHYGAAWRFNDSLFGLLVRLFDDAHRPLLDNGVYLAFRRPKIVVGTILACMGLWFIFRERDWLRSGYWMTGTLLLLSPTVHPWYVTPILPFLCFYRNIGWILFTCLVTLSYSAVVVLQQTGEWPTITLFSVHEGIETTAVAWLEYAPLFLLLLWDRFRHRETVE